MFSGEDDASSVSSEEDSESDCEHTFPSVVQLGAEPDGAVGDGDDDSEGSGSFDGEEDDEGEDWDELEKKAKRGQL